MIPTRRQFINRAPNRIHDCLDILVEFLISEADELKTTRGKPGGAPLAMLDGDRIQVLRAIELDDKLVGEANEINNVRAYGGLTAELPAAQLLSAKEVPQAFFSRRWVGCAARGRSRAGSRRGTWLWFTPSLTLPARGREPNRMRMSGARGRDQTSTGDPKSPERSAVVSREANGEG